MKNRNKSTDKNQQEVEEKKATHANKYAEIFFAVRIELRVRSFLFVFFFIWFVTLFSVAYIFRPFHLIGEHMLFLLIFV